MKVILSIVIVNWNTKDYLKSCLESIYSSNLPEFEVIVVDNDSQDDSIIMMENNFPSVSLIRNPSNLGFARACNQGIACSNGEYLAFVNTDIQVFKNTFSEIVDFMVSHPQASMVGPKILSSEGKQQRSFMSFPSLKNTLFRAVAIDRVFPRSRIFGEYLMTYFNTSEPVEVDILNGCFWVVRRDAVDSVGTLDERFFIYSEDKDWCKRFWEKGHKIMYLPSSSAIHYEGISSSADPIRFNQEMIMSNLKYWNKHFSKFNLFFYKNILVLHYLIRFVTFSFLRCADKKFQYKQKNNMLGLKLIIREYF